MALQLTSVGHAAGIFADMSVDGPAIGTLVAVVDRAKNLPNRKTMGKQNPYCAARLGKEAKKTNTDLRGGQTPKWDQELRFTVHESPDYTRLKLSVFNDDKRTDMIGETWIDLQDLIIPGGSQSDQWHTLQFRGKYAGEIRLEMTYYDTRPEDVAVIERRTGTQVTDRGPKPSSRPAPAPVVPSPAPSSSSSLSGPRQLKEVKRRPLPTEAPRPAPEKAYSAPAPMPSRPAYDGIPTPPSSSGMDYAPPPRTAPPMSGYDVPPTRPRMYETPDDFQQWNNPPPRRQPQGYPPDSYSREDYYARPHSGYANAPPADYRSMRQDLPVGRQDPYEADMPIHEAPGPTTGHYGHPYQDQYAYGEEPQARYHASSMSSRHRFEYPQESVHANSYPKRGRSPGRSGREYHPEYAAMQPRVEDEYEEGPPPPPPIHRSGLVHTSQQVRPADSYEPPPAYGADARGQVPRPPSGYE
ncbi:hypothetical protein BDV06DRAFT_56194 [Aspergillus oleicola]